MCLLTNHIPSNHLILLYPFFVFTTPSLDYGMDAILTMDHRVTEFPNAHMRYKHLGHGITRRQWSPLDLPGMGTAELAGRKSRLISRGHVGWMCMDTPYDGLLARPFIGPSGLPCARVWVSRMMTLFLLLTCLPNLLFTFWIM